MSSGLEHRPDASRKFRRRDTYPVEKCDFGASSKAHACTRLDALVYLQQSCMPPVLHPLSFSGQ